MTSPTSGYILATSEESYSGEDLLPHNTLRVPPGHVIMISFAHLPSGRKDRSNVIALGFRDDKGTLTGVWNWLRHRYFETNVLDMSFITLQWYTKYKPCFKPDCFKLVYSFHVKSKAPRKLSSGLYNCSVDDYWRFRQHLDCNLKVECEDGRDESGPCPVTSPACRPWGASGHKCFKFVSKETLLSLDLGDESMMTKTLRYCQSVNGSLGQPKDVRDMRLMKSILTKHESCSGIEVGLFLGGIFVPNIYRQSTVTIDRTVLHHTVNDYKRLFAYSGETCVRLLFTSRLLEKYPCSGREDTNTCSTCAFILKEKDKHHSARESITLANVTLTFKEQHQSLTKCTDGHITHSFLSGDPHYECQEGMLLPCAFLSCSMNHKSSLYDTEKQMTSFALFTCRDGISLSYTLVCDFRPDCKDGSDESFCLHPPCDEITCDSGQCVSYTKVCDMISDCFDDSDEKKCTNYREITLRWENDRTLRSPVLIKLDGIRSFSVRNMHPAESCPDTHYRCTGEYNDCLPVFTRCNGWHDCLSQEDEADCDKMICPGFYRCLYSSVCVHSDHLCDKWPHCPQRDDEWLCNMTCPTQCLCQGHSFLCSQPFAAHLFPQLRYLDARGSGIRPSTLTDNFYIM